MTALKIRASVPPMLRQKPAFAVLASLTLASIFALLYLAFFRAPVAQAEAGGMAQKIFYFHVPSAYAMYLSGVVCCVASAIYLLKLGNRSNAWAEAGAECATIFGILMITSGLLWAKKAWGVYWTWDPRLTTTLLSLLVYAAVVLLRRFGGSGEAERKFAAALGVLGTVNLPIIHYSVRKWGGNHPVVITKGGGGLSHPDMKLALSVGFLAFTLLAGLLLWQRARTLELSARLRDTEERAIDEGLAKEA
ncbi:MAG TPA: cytochrome c biogenesis protein CcsA [Polyangiaceae bacterium]|nr:cytochrome c biogenesis protein CcsA [Polyangiaceae bacterium]